VVHDRRDLVVGRDLQELGIELVALADVDRLDRVLESRLLEEHRDLVAVGRGPVVEVDHRGISEAKADSIAQGADVRALVLVGQAARRAAPSRRGAASRIAQHRARKADRIGVAVRHDLLGLHGVDDEPDRERGCRASPRIAAAKGTW
jgi:hypothetical protein